MTQTQISQMFQEHYDREDDKRRKTVLAIRTARTLKTGR